MYPDEPCTNHPNGMWEWDGYGWICVECVLKRYNDSTQMLGD